ncbi:hypothetical protein C1646_677203 [Rhizophagus diaphanus]|nr:hypothetical protein C1646_677203 [Rhizophagus diaphanus] [Rhizophagus sp. MUCL 43196]
MTGLLELRSDSYILSNARPTLGDQDGPYLHNKERRALGDRTYTIKVSGREDFSNIKDGIILTFLHFFRSPDSFRRTGLAMCQLSGTALRTGFGFYGTYGTPIRMVDLFFEAENFIFFIQKQLTSVRIVYTAIIFPIGPFWIGDGRGQTRTTFSLSQLSICL